ncbi:hypothetical protein A2Z33_05360 [Candidatus Gottesmanbacteria bacterium RBG_16_52_11]|uniref:DNA 3'-5' helicase n=1 Tax=Candidatus Gottesmanbacteria bacterium RBG_16_52_11 TaxID=1798374 RepID=A0A1F5YMP3_9BACT|nr:MAG: hypothetical protein A2Z33_05360 [Candidatus Gottesmanbacteria bacterium RBG_16_52_11]
MNREITVDGRTLNPDQKKAVKFGNGPLLIIAGAGTGKTTVVTERIRHLISTGKCKPQEILALTFTEKASREMEERVDRAMPYGLPEMWISTFHSFCDRVLRAEAINIGLDPAFKLMTEAETIQFFRSHLFEFDLSYFRPLGNPAKFISGMITHFSRLKDEDIKPGEYLEWAEKLSRKKRRSKEEKLDTVKYLELANGFRKYEELKVSAGCADYADLISNTLKLLRTRIDILGRYRKQFRYILIDEFQDTNHAQNELALLLAGQDRNITVVGDDDQAIYRFRGAAVSNILTFRQHFPDAEIIVLTKNYRSTKEILDRSYDLIQHNNPDRLEAAEGIDKKLDSMRRVNGGKINLVYTDRVENEAEQLAGKIKKIKESGPGDGKTYEWSDFAVLVRANNHAEPFIRAFSRAGIPYQFLGPGQLFRQAEVKDLVAYLKVLADFSDSVAAYRVMTMDFLGLSPRDMAVLLSFAKRYGLSLFEATEKTVGQAGDGNGVADNEPVPQVSPGGQQQCIRFVAMVGRHMKLIKSETAGQILYYFLEDTGLLKQLTGYKTVRGERIAGNIAKFFDKLKSYEINHDDASVFAVVDWIDLSLALGESPLASDTDWSVNNAVNILTVHSAKGLEFPVVFMVNLVGARFPTTERREQIPIPEELIKELLPVGDFHLEEERRLFYVGMTRARDRLIFTAAKYYGEGKREKKISPFVAEALGSEGAPDLVTLSSPDSQLPLLEWSRPAQSGAEDAGRHPVSFLSFSQLDTFETCPLKYKYRYVLRIPVPPSAALTFGDTVHRTLKSFYDRLKKGDKPSVNLLLRIFRSHWSPVGYGHKPYEEKMKQRGEAMLKSYYRTGFSPDRLPGEMEYPFRIRISEGLTVGGKIDRIDRLPDGTVEIIDYKTGNAPKSKDAASDMQLTLYALAAAGQPDLGADPDRTLVSFYFLEDQTKMSASRSADELASARRKIADKAAQIGSSEFAPTPGKHCDFCEFRLICEAWQ